jgi:REP element-mobilizing transposase RayT
MKEFVYKGRTERNLPHIHSLRATLFVTFRLSGTIPKPVLRLYHAQKEWLEDETKRITRLLLSDDSPELRAHENRLVDFQRQWFIKFEDILHKAEYGPTWLKDEAVAQIVADALHYRDGKIYRLDAYSIMSNHVHTVFAPFLSERDVREVLLPEGLRFFSKNPPLDVIMKSLKGYTAWECNRTLQRKGTFWQAESYDHIVRDSGEFNRIVNYVLNNPVKAGLVRDWRDWKWNYCRESVLQAVASERN